MNSHAQAAVPDDTRELAVAVATRGRPETLARLLGSIGHQEMPGWRIVCCIADNDPGGGAAGTVRDDSRVETRYVVEKRAGIPYARNASVALADSAEVIAFVDDDEELPPDWARLMLRHLDTSGADVVTGPVVTEIPRDAPDWVRDGGWFTRHRFPSGTQVRTAATNNTIVRRWVLDALGPEPFDVTLAATGGSDTDFFRRAVEKGARIEWCDDAPVIESVASDRLRRSWIYRRSLRTGGTRGRHLRLTGGRRAVIVEAGAVVLAGISSTLRSLARGRAPGKAGWGRILYGVGVLLAAVGVSVNEYGGRTLGRLADPRGTP